MEKKNSNQGAKSLEGRNSETESKVPQKAIKTSSQQIIGKSPQSSTRVTKKTLDIQRLKSIHQNIYIGQNKAFVVGFSGGDCAGKKQMLNYLFQKSEDGVWKLRDTNESVCIIHQDYFWLQQSKKYRSQGINWNQFNKIALTLSIGNEANIFSKKENREIRLKPAKILIIQGSHIFMETPQIKPLFDLINTKIFIDSDSDTRLSRRIYQDTQDRKIELEQSIRNYLENIKFSYEKQIEPTKVKSDIILPHFGGGYDDHKSMDRKDQQSNIKNAGSLIISHIKQHMSKYEKQQFDMSNEL